MSNPILTAQVKRKLNVTWDDEDTDARIEEIIESAIPDLIHRLGISDKDFDFSQKGAENTLFLSYCLYEWNHMLEEFDVNYARMIATVRAIHAVNQFKEQSDEEV